MFIRTTALTPVELRSAIVREPLVVSPDTTVRDAIAQMSGVRTICQTTKTADDQMDNLHLEARSSCVLVVENDQLLGIVTERDVVRLSAQQQVLDSLVMRQVMAHPIVTLRESAFTDLFFAINLLQHHHIRHLPIVDEYNHLVGLVTHESLRQTSRPIDLLRLRMVEEVMTNKVVCAAPDSSMLAIAQLMAETRVSSVMIVESASSPAEPLQIPVGIVTERDIVQFQALGLSLEIYLAQAVMSTPIFAVKPDDSLWTVQQLMEQRLINRLAVTGEQGELLGIVTQTSLLQALNPLELYKLAEMLEEKVVRLETEKVQLLENLLEQEVETRTIALKAKAGREKLVADVATQIRSSLSLQTILDTTVEQIRQVLGCDRVNIWQFEADWETIVVAESTDSPLSLLGERINDTCFKQQEAEIYRQGRIRVVPDIFTTEMSDCHRQMLIRLQTRAKIIVPLLRSDELWGLLNVSESQYAREWLPEEVELLQALAVHLAIALQQATTHQQLQEELSTRQRIENQLRDSEERYATLVEAAPVGIFRTDAAGNCIYVNDRWCQISGLNPKTAAREGWRQGLHPEDRDAIAAEWHQSAQENRPFQLEYRFQRADGVVTWVYGQSVAELDAEGQVVGYVGTVTDISDRKQAEIALSQLAAIVESSADAIISKTLDGEIVSWNKGAEKLFGYQAQEVIGQSILLLIPNELKDEESFIIEKVRQGEVIHHYETVRQNKDGKLIDISLTVSPIKDATGKIVGASKISRDISDACGELRLRKLAEAALIQSEAHQRALITAIPDLMMRIDRRGIYLEFVTTSSNFPVVGNLSEMVGSHVFDSLPPDAAQKRMDFIQRALDMNSIQIYEQELDIDGKKQIEEIRVVPYSKDEVLALVRDITDRKQAEAALIQSEAQSRAILSAIPDFMFRMSADGIYRGFVTTNRQIDFLPQDCDTVGLAMVDLVPVEIADRHLHYLKQALRTGELQVYEQQVQIGDRFQDEEVRVVKSSEDEALFMIRDISAACRELRLRKQTEEALIRSQEQLSLVLKGSNDGWWDWNLIENDIYYSPRWWGILGYESEEIEAAPELWQQRMHPDDLDRVNQFLQQQITNGIEYYEVEFRLLHKQEHYVPVISRGFILRDDRGTPIRISGTNTDLTELKKAEEQLRELNQQLEAKVKERTQELSQVNSLQGAILDGADYSIISTDLTGIIQTFNAGAEVMLGYSAAEMVGKVTPAILHDVKEVIDRAASLSIELGQDIPPGFEVFVAKARQDTIGEEEWSYIRKDGSRFPVSLSLTPLKDANHQIIGFLGIAKDISDRKQAELERQKLSDRLALSLKAAAIGCWEWNIGQNTVLGDDRIYELFGLTKQSNSLINYDTWVNELLHPDDRISTETLLHQAVLGEAEYNTEYRIVRPDGSIHFVKANGMVVRDAQGNPQSMIGVNFDISARKQAEIERQKLSERLALSLKSGAIGCWEWDIVQNILLWDERMYELYGVTKSSDSRLVYDIWVNGLHPDDRNSNDTLIRQAVLGQAEFDTEFRVLHPDGSIHFIKAYGVVARDAQGNPQSMTGVNFDISDRKQAEAAIQEENNFRQQILESMVEGLCVFHEIETFPFIRFTVWNQQMQAITGYTLEEINRLGWYQSVYPDAWAQEQAIANLRQMQQGESLIAQERQIQCKDGQKRTVALSTSILSNNDDLTEGSPNVPTYILALIQDITDRKENEQAMIQQLAAIEAAIDGIGIIQGDKYIYVNQSHVELFGYQHPEELVGKSWKSFYPPEELERLEQEVFPMLENDRAWQGEAIAIRKDGSTFTEGVSKTITDNGLLICVCRDISDRKQAELKLQQQAEQERLLSTITQRMRSSLNLEEILNVTVQELHHVLRSDRVLVYRVFPGGTGAAIAESVSPNWPKILDIVFPEEVFPEANYDRYVRGRIYVLTDAKGSAKRLREDENQSILPCLIEFLADIQVRAKLVVPIIQNQTLWGLLIAHQCDRPRQWEDWEINLLKQTANQLAIAIQQSNLFKQLEQELIERQRAEAQLTETNAQLAISNEELIRATRLKDEFLANMSHELRTPLNAILGMSEGLQEQVFGIVNEPQIKALQTIDRSGSHLLELINDILDVAKIESGQMELDYTTVSLNYLCQSSLTFIKQLALKKRIQLEMKLPLNLPDLLIDERRIRQVLINLLNNAVKFTPEGGRITLEVSRQQRETVLTPPSLQGIAKVSLFQTTFEPELGIKPQLEGVEVRNYLRIAVIDTGIGIAPENINKLFQPFIQIDSALNRQYAGTGLGLALVKRIVELHGGEVGLTSKIGVGSCFTIDLPYGAIAPSSATELSPRQTSDLESQGATPMEPTQPEQLTSPLILLAEDNEANITTFSSYLGAKGYRILLAKNGQEAIDCATTHQPNLILMDIQMPGMDGLEATRQIRRDPNLVNIPIIALTALAMTGDREKCLEAGANDYMTKPVKLKQLAATIQELLDAVNC
ncbi:PAS domain S-box protein [Kamptonema sp. UHCC 0994]|uniref:PAS domain S-box protein n=1 Tax=Kamptonema sp. UHCC 0994 TaxID=3031329 RepID=UPI0023B8FE71|nr:PAS domain S-box protein [Kamptonema sp. UHCC 0994]MDF0553338.1 PAS domain S-box protein [Kamptonema sp. UHCC 0994]